MLKFVYPAIFEENSDGSFTVKFPDLPGCITYGENAADALIMAQDAACGRILGELEDGKLIPKPSAYKEIVLSDTETLSLMALDIDAYSAQYGSKTVKKNTTIPAWLNAFGEKKNINYSRLLTDALTELYMAEMC